MNCFDCNIPCEYSNPLGYCMLTYCAKKKFEEGAEPADAMKALDEKIKKVSERGTWDGVDVDKYIAALRGRDTELQQAASDLVDAVERYMRQECLRSKLAMKKDKLKALLNE